MGYEKIQTVEEATTVAIGVARQTTHALHNVWAELLLVNDMLAERLKTVDPMAETGRAAEQTNLAILRARRHLAAAQRELGGLLDAAAGTETAPARCIQGAKAA
jgi:hypothetical protein